LGTVVTDSISSPGTKRGTLDNPIEYARARRIWVQDDHVFVETHRGTIFTMTPEVAIEFGRLVSSAGADALINRVIMANPDEARGCKSE